MSSKLFIENGEPHRAILVMDQGDILECKTSGFTLNYDKRTFTGYIKVKDMPYEMMPLSSTKVLKQIEFTGPDHVMQIMDKLDKIIPEQKLTRGATHAVLGEGDAEDLKRIAERKEAKTKTDNSPTLEEKPNKVKEKVKAHDNEPQKSDTKQSQKGDKKPKMSFTSKINDLKDLPKAFRNQGKHQNNNDKGKDKDKKKETQAPKPEVKKPLESKSEKTQWDGAIVVGIDAYREKGLCLVHIYKNAKKEDEAVILNSLRIEGLPEPAPFIFAKEGTGKYFSNGLMKHPRWQPTAGMFEIYPIAELDPKTIGDKGLLVKDPEKLLNHMERVSKSGG